MNDLLKIMLSYVAKQHGMTEEQVAELITTKSEDDDKIVLVEDALQKLLDKDVERVKGLKAAQVDKTKIYDTAYAEAKKKVLSKTEKSLAEKYGIDGTFKIDELVEKIVAVKTEAAAEGNKLTIDDVKKHPEFLSLEKSLNQKIADLTEVHKTEIEGIQLEHKKGEILSRVKKVGLSKFDSMNPILSKTPTKAQNQRNNFSTIFNNYDYEEVDGSFIVIKDGKRVEDAHGNPISIDKLVEIEADKQFDFAVQKPKGSSGNQGITGGTGFKVPTNEEEYSVAILGAATAEERAQIADAYEASK